MRHRVAVFTFVLGIAVGIAMAVGAGIDRRAVSDSGRGSSRTGSISTGTNLFISRPVPGSRETKLFKVIDRVQPSTEELSMEPDDWYIEVDGRGYILDPKR